MKKIVGILLVLALVASFAGCGKTAAAPYVGCTIYKFDDTFMSLVRQEIQKDATDKIKLSVQDSQNSQPTQNDQVDTFLTQGVTALALNLVDPSAVSVVIQKAKAKNIPVVLFNREPDPTDMAAWNQVYYVGAKAQQSGTYQGEMMAAYWKAHPAMDLNHDGVLDYVMLMGDPSNTDAKYRTQYSIEALTAAGVKSKVLAQDTAMWDRVTAQSKMAAFIAANPGKIEAVFANNDDMALGAIEALKAAGLDKNGKIIPVVGVDATPPGLDAMKQGTLIGTVLNDATRQGDATYDLAFALGTGAATISTTVGPLCDQNGTVDAANGRYVWVPYVKVTPDNYQQYVAKP